MTRSMRMLYQVTTCRDLLTLANIEENGELCMELTSFHLRMGCYFVWMNRIRPFKGLGTMT